MNNMEKVIVKIELDRDDVSAMVRLIGSKLTDEQWDKMKARECTIDDEDMEDQAAQMKLVFSGFAFYKLLKNE